MRINTTEVAPPRTHESFRPATKDIKTRNMIAGSVVRYCVINTKPERPIEMAAMGRILNTTFSSPPASKALAMLSSDRKNRIELTASGNSPGPGRPRLPIEYENAPRPNINEIASINKPCNIFILFISDPLSLNNLPRAALAKLTLRKRLHSKQGEIG